MKLVDLESDTDYLLDGKYKVKAGSAYNFVHNSMDQSLKTYPDIDFARRNAVRECRNCKFYAEHDDKSDGFGKCFRNDRLWSRNEYCSRWEKGKERYR